MKKPLTKRKMYQKRRKREKEEKRRYQKQQTSIRGASEAGLCANIKYNSNTIHQQPFNTMNVTTAKSNSQHMYNNQHISQPLYTNPLNSYTKGMHQWWQTYCTAIQYHNEQGKQWKASCSSGENHSQTHTELLERYADEYETSSDEEDEEEHYLEPTKEKCDQQTLVHHEEEEQEDTDTEYLKFLEITHRHREELRLKRAAENSN